MASWRSVLLSLALVPVTTVAAAAPARIVVKYRPAVSACIHCLVAKRKPFATATGTTTLDSLHAQLGVRRARPVFFDRHASGGRSYPAALADVAQRFSRRTARRRAAPAAPDLSNVYVLDIGDGVDVEAAAARCAADPSVEYAHPDHEVSVSFVPSDPYLASSGSWGQAYADLWGLHLTRAPEAWDVARGAGTVVAIVDTGIQHTHPDLAGNSWTNPGEIPGNGIDDEGNGYVDDVRGWDMHSGDNDPSDENGHGTHVAGTVAAVGNNGLGVVGMAWDARVMAVRGFGPDGRGDVSNLAAGIVYAALNGADVINNSWGGYSSDAVVADAVATARSLGAVVVAAAGNGATSVDVFEPARLEGVIAVAATDYQDAPASFSNYGEAISVAAPGVDVLSLRAPAWTGLNVLANNYLHISGTSMASPHVAGLAAVLLSALPGLTAEEVRWHLELNAEQPGSPGYEGQRWNPFYGYGRIDAARVFDTPPVTTRVRPRAIERHVFTDEIASGAETIDLDFTSLSPVAWTLAGPGWLTPTTTSGAGPADVSLDLDTTGLAAGTTYADALTVSASGASDGGASLPATAHVHRDFRVGPEITIHEDPYAGVVPVLGPSIASNGRDTIFVWLNQLGGTPLLAATLDESGTVSAPVVLTQQPVTNFVAGSDGTNFLVAWTEDSGGYPIRPLHVRARRIGPTGALLDAQPIEIESKEHVRSNSVYVAPRTTFDGQTYRVLWEYRTVGSSGYRSRYQIAPVASDGTVGKRRRVKAKMPRGLKPEVLYVDPPHLGCGTGQCLFAWSQLELTGPNAFENHVYGVPIVAGKPDYRRAAHLLADAALASVAAGGGGYFALAQRVTACAGTGIGPIVSCAIDVLGTRVGADGQPPDPTGIRLNRDPAVIGHDRSPMNVVFDGTHWVAAFITARAPRLPGEGSAIFFARVDSGGSLLAPEAEGLLVRGGATARLTRLVAADDHVLVAWRDKRLAKANTGDNAFGSIYAQRIATQGP